MQVPFTVTTDRLSFSRFMKVNYTEGHERVKNFSCCILFLFCKHWFFAVYKWIAVGISHGWPPLWSSGQSNWLHNGDVLCFLWGMNWIYICYIEESRSPLWSSSQSSWLHNGDVLCFLWGMNWIYICYIEESRSLLWSSSQSSWLHNGDVLCFLWGMNWIYICYIEESRSPLWSSDLSSWARGSVLVKALCYKQEGHGFDTR
jgi:hypothetical protein